MFNYFNYVDYLLCIYSKKVDNDEVSLNEAVEEIREHLSTKRIVTEYNSIKYKYN